MGMPANTMAQLTGRKQNPGGVKLIGDGQRPFQKRGRGRARMQSGVSEWEEAG